MGLKQLITAAVIVVGTIIVAKLVDHALRRRRKNLPPAALTRYDALRRTISAVILVVGAAMALFVFPSARGVAGAVLSSAAFLSVVIGLAAQTSLGNFFAGLVVSFSQPIRIGDRIEFRHITGVVEDISRIYTRVRTSEGAWELIPNSLLASDTIRNWTIVNPECTAIVTVSVPITADLGRVIETVGAEARALPGTLEGREPTMTVQDLTSDTAELEVGVWVKDHRAAGEAASALRVRVQERLRHDGLLATP